MLTLSSGQDQVFLVFREDGGRTVCQYTRRPVQETVILTKLQQEYSVRFELFNAFDTYCVNVDACAVLLFRYSLRAEITHLSDFTCLTASVGKLA
jgi:hypothetical protein